MTDQHPPLTDLIGLAPNLTGGRSVEDHLRDQWCDGPHLDEAAIRADERRKTAEEIAQRIHDRFDHLVAPEHESMRVVAEWCEREAREIGGTS